MIFLCVSVRDEWNGWVKALNLLDDCINVRQCLPVLKLRQPVGSDDSNNFLVCTLLDVSIAQYERNECKDGPCNLEEVLQHTGRKKN